MKYFKSNEQISFEIRDKGIRDRLLLLGASVLAHPMTPYSLKWGVKGMGVDAAG